MAQLSVANCFADEICQDGVLFRPTGEVRKPNPGEYYRGWSGGCGEPYIATGEVKVADDRICSHHAIYAHGPQPLTESEG